MTAFALQPKSTIWLDGKFISASKANTNIFDHGLHYASSVFEGIRVYNGKPFKLHEHNQRLIASAKILDFTIPYTVKQLDQATTELSQHNKLKNAYIRPIAWCGDEHMGVDSIPCVVHVAIAAWPCQSVFTAEQTNQGIKLCLADWVRPDPRSAPTQAKAAGLYMTSTICKNQAQRKGFDNALMLDWRGFVAECTAANIFFVINNELHTPIADCFLDGITRQTVIQLAQDMNYKVKERHIKYEEITTADEVFITGTAAEVTPVGQIEQHKYKIGAITKKLRNAYLKLVQ